MCGYLSLEIHLKEYIETEYIQVYEQTTLVRLPDNFFFLEILFGGVERIEVCTPVLYGRFQYICSSEVYELYALSNLVQEKCRVK